MLQAQASILNVYSFTGSLGLSHAHAAHPGSESLPHMPASTPTSRSGIPEQSPQTHVHSLHCLSQEPKQGGPHHVQQATHDALIQRWRCISASSQHQRAHAARSKLGSCSRGRPTWPGRSRQLPGSAPQRWCRSAAGPPGAGRSRAPCLPGHPWVPTCLPGGCRGFPGTPWPAGRLPRQHPSAAWGTLAR